MSQELLYLVLHNTNGERIQIHFDTHKSLLNAAQAIEWCNDGTEIIVQKIISVKYESGMTNPF